MSNKFKKLSLKIEYLSLELEEVDELASEYQEKFSKDFYNEIAFMKSFQKEQKKDIRSKPTRKPHPPPILQKIYRNLAKILHPDVSLLSNAEEEFKRVSDCYDNLDLSGLLIISNKYNIEIPNLSEEECFIINDALLKTEKKIASNQNTISWLWGSSHEDKEVLRKKIHEAIGINQEEFYKWKKEN